MEFFISSLDIDDAYIVQVPSLGNESLNLQNYCYSSNVKIPTLLTQLR
jgi:hypothetical protein